MVMHYPESITFILNYLIFFISWV